MLGNITGRILASSRKATDSLAGSGRSQNSNQPTASRNWRSTKDDAVPALSNRSGRDLETLANEDFAEALGPQIH